MFRTWISNHSDTAHLKKKAAPTTPARSLVERLEERRLLAAWSLQDQIVGLDKAAANYPAITGAGETVALIDQGVDYNHPALAGKVIDQWNFDTGTGDVFPYDNNSHGTGSAGQVAGSQRIVNGQIYQGIAPGVNLVALKASGTWNVKQAFDWVIAHRAQDNIVAVNWVDPTGGSDSNVFLGELQTLKAEGVFVGAPTGNYGPANAVTPPGDGYFQAGATTLYNSLASISPRGSAVDLFAPGENVDVTWYYSGTHAELPSTGTSWAGPQMVGAAALIKQVNPNFTPDQIMKIMQDSGTTVYDSYSGQNYQQLNVNNAIALAYQESGQAPVATPPVATPAIARTPAPVVAPVVVTPAPVPGPATTEQPFSGTPFNAGQPITAAFYDIGGEGGAYHTTSNYNESGNNSFRPGDTVAIGWSASNGGSSYVGWTHAGEWLNYTINVAAAGNYTFSANAADPNSGGTFHFSIDGTSVGKKLTVPTTGSFDSFAAVTTGGVYLTAGRHIMAVSMDTSGVNGFVGNFRDFGFNPASTPAAAPPPNNGYTPNAPTALSAFAGSLDRNVLAFYDNSNIETSYLIERSTWNGGYTPIATITTGTGAGTGWRYWTDTGLAAGQTYYYRVSAANAVGSSGYAYTSTQAV